MKENKKIYLQCTDLYPPLWQKEYLIKLDYTDKMIKYSNLLKSEISKKFETVGYGYFGTFIDALFKKCPRYELIKNITAPDGTKYDLQIDLLLHLATFIEI